MNLRVVIVTMIHRVIATASKAVETIDAANEVKLILMILMPFSLNPAA
jgi:hypothetical protein